MDDYVTKPAELATLRQKLSRWLASDSLDPARIQQLAGDPEGIAEVLKEFEAGMRTDIAALQVALESANCAALRRAAHRIRGSALTIGAETLAALAARVEDAPASVDEAQLMDSAHALLEELERVVVSAGAQRSALSS
jgi:HPt (histidine-containing phosphotransfer) domain-containing protein